MSLVVLYEGKRKTISLSPSSTLQQFADAAVAAFEINIPSSSFVLTHKNVAVDRSIPLRLSGLPNNSLMELCNTNSLKRGVKSAVTGDARIAVSVGGLGKASGTFKSSLSLLDVISTLQTQSLLPSFPLNTIADIGYLGQVIAGSDLENTTLQMLGLGGQSGRLQVRLLDPLTTEPTVPSEEKTVIDIPNTDQKLEHFDVKMAIEQSQSMEVVEPENDEDQSISEGPTLRKRSSSVSDVLTSISEVLPSPRAAIETITSAAASITSSSAAVAPEPVPPVAQFGLSHLEQAMRMVLESNFDAVSSASLITIAKYVNNLLKHFSTLHMPDCKYSRINRKNRLFCASVGAARGALDVLLAIGFIEIDSDTLQLHSSVYADEVEGYNYLRNVRVSLESALDELQVNPDDRPAVPPLASTSTKGEGGIATAPVDFDPYKSYHFSTTGNKPPQSGGESTVDLALKAAMRRKQEIYGEVHSVSRNTEIHLPVSDDDAAVPDGKSSKLASQVEDDEPENDPSSRRLVAAALMKRISSSNSEEGPPLTTRALRDLERAKKEVIYGETLVQIKFPDRVVLLGHFHPLNTMQDVYVWLGEYLSDNIVTAGVTPSDVASAIDIYITPPRQSLPPNHKTLEELRLVPAASLYASVRVSPQEKCPVSAGWYLKTTSDAKIICRGGSTAPTKAYPTGVSLFPSDSGESKAENSSAGDMMSAESKSETKKSGDGKRSKPKWMKL